MPDTMLLGSCSALCGKTLQPGAFYRLADARLGFVYETDFRILFLKLVRI